MFGNKYLYQAVLSLNLACCVCYVNYNMFEGFNKPISETQKIFARHRKRGNEVYIASQSDYEDTDSAVSTPVTSSAVPTPVTSSAVPTPVTSSAVRTPVPSSVVPTRVTTKRKEIHFITANDDQYQSTTEMEHEKPTVNVKEFNKHCPETEQPLSLGTYEIPTQRDLVLFTQRTVLKLFNSYHEKTLLFLKDIKEATRATAAVEKKCYGRGKGLMYKQCVKQVNKKFVTITKELVKTLERQEAEVTALTDGKICELSSMKTNPILLIKILAMEEAALTFALPAFLRLLGGCSIQCNKPAEPDHRPRLLKMTDQELVVRHFLTNKTYYQLLKDKTYV